MSYKVLVVDDSAVMRKIIIRALYSLELKDVEEAGDGQEALELFAESNFDMVLTDWNMPNKTGLDVLKGIRESGSDIPVIMITTDGEKKRVLEAIQAGVSDFLIKPFEREDLLAKLEKFVPAQYL